MAYPPMPAWIVKKCIKGAILGYSVLFGGIAALDTIMDKKSESKKNKK